MFCRGKYRDYLRLVPSVVCRAAVAVPSMWLSLFVGASANAAECAFPDNIDWVVDQSCEISGIQIAPRNLSVIDGAVLTIQSSGELILPSPGSGRTVPSRRGKSGN